MQIINTINELRSALEKQTSVAFVPTMGNLHAGHIQLVEVAKRHAQCVVVSIFVNPLQFGVNEDLASYPRTLDADCKKLEAAGTSIVFAPKVEEMYPDFDGGNLNQTMTITPPPIANELCGASRPGHFSGVATVVMKLFNIVQPTVAVFGKKDFQQLFIIEQLVKQFNLPIEVIGVHTVREPSSLAMSSRNGYLTSEQRNQASQLNNTLQDIVNLVNSGANDYPKLEQQAKTTLIQQGWLVDYISIRSSLTLAPAKDTDSQLVVLGAAKLANTRLIDNIEFLR
ncbi:pantoate--beta-alanine ligase [Methylotenera sp.]|uniref:pantoate--beta-alanine ligase n=3 Tax=Methylotenera sp. TaxID=2051956 RepID=UPI002725449C|nr:pantoate--beta-alanine ligase [Methylotenera sp.]MDO9206201.1 pantoate--beta-alanine ligase [Methylotenera sp.]MDP1523747.1 pantoate--beta-alanine ligase [Methylotenera sp.]MDP2070873.1 pantoate--beta-alanine ligase [Methylotenera sp.]MDP2230228.1 pantoate--beta-alanine ligase [Methylotenera sp.]MDP3005747.1 pantoate--beta-alanine ligase [Methylotenera sp.]